MPNEDQPLANDYLPIKATLWSHFLFYIINLPLNNDHMSTTTTEYGSWVVVEDKFDFVREKDMKHEKPNRRKRLRLAL
jgi:hypothetical protein